MKRVVKVKTPELNIDVRVVKIFQTLFTRAYAWTYLAKEKSSKG